MSIGDKQGEQLMGIAEVFYADKVHATEKTIKCFLDKVLEHTSEKLKRPGILGIFGKTKPEKKAFNIMLKDNQKIMQQSGGEDIEQKYKAYKQEMKIDIKSFRRTEKAKQMQIEANNKIVSNTLAVLAQKGQTRDPKEIAEIVAQEAYSVAEGYRKEYKKMHNESLDRVSVSVYEQENKEVIEQELNRLDSLYTAYTFAQGYAESVGDYILAHDSSKGPVKQGFERVVEIMKKERLACSEMQVGEKADGTEPRMPLENYCPAEAIDTKGTIGTKSIGGNTKEEKAERKKEKLPELSN